MNKILSVLLMALLSACVTTTPVPPDVLKPARDGVRAAVAAGADRHAPLELRFAREKLAAAEQAVADGDGVLSRRLARQASLDAELSAAKAIAAMARDAVRAQRQANDDLRVELEAGK